MPSTFVPFMMTSALISMARSAAAVSVLKYGFPVPAPKTMTRPFSRGRMRLYAGLAGEVTNTDYSDKDIKENRGHKGFVAFVVLCVLVGLLRRFSDLETSEARHRHRGAQRLVGGGEHVLDARFSGRVT